MSQQSLRQASIRAVTGTALTYEGDWHALFTMDGISSGFTDSQGVFRPATYDERLLAWINLKLSASYVNLPEAQQALANYAGAFNFSSIGTFDPSVGPPVGGPYLNFGINTNSMYVPLLFEDF